MKLTTTKLLASTICASLLLTGCVATTKEGGTAPAEVKGGFLGLSKAAALDVSTGKAFSGAKEVVIGGFKVGFVERKKDSSKAGGGLMGNGFGGKSTARLKLIGIDAATQQKITDAAYADFVADLKAQGYEIKDRSTLLSHAKFSGVKQYDMPLEKDNSGILSDYGVTRYFAPTAFGKTSPIFLGEIAGETGGFGFANPAAPSAEFATESGVRVLNVTYVLDFANADKYGGKFTSTSSVTVGQGLSVVPGAVVGIVGGHSGTFSSSVGSIRTGQPIYSTDTFGDIKETSTSGEKAVERVTNVIGLIGGVGSNIATNYEVQADPAKYSKVAKDVLGQANDAMIGEMTKLR